MGNEVLIKFGERLRELRKERGLSQEALGLACNTTQAHISRVESGERNICLINIQELADVLGVSLEELFRGL